MSSRRRDGFTLIELLVVITIMGMLMAMIFPAFGAILESVRRAGCVNNLSSISKAIDLYESGAGNGFPGLVEAGRKSRKYPNGVPMTWATTILDQLGSKELHKTWYEPEDGKPEMTVEPVKVYFCTSDNRDDLSAQQLSYVINAGAIEDGKDPAIAGVTGRAPPQLSERLMSNGIAFNRYNTTPGVIARKVTKSGIQSKKGLAYTALLSENVQAMNWGDKRVGESPPLAYDNLLTAKNSGAPETQMYTGFVWNGLGINQTETDDQDIGQIDRAPNPMWARPSSNHPDGVNMIFCNGGVKFVTNAIEVYVYQALCMTNPKTAIGEGMSPLVKEYSPADGDF
ncbi:MAG: DUF1559 domain-containing protein [Pirellulales bacterium]